jgi:hypothetical protein
MTTFTTEDRIFAEKDGSYTANIEGGTITASPPHIVDSGASVMIKDLTDAEIDSLIAEVAEKPTDEDLYDFAIAILRKAQEK